MKWPPTWARRKQRPQYRALFEKGKAWTKEHLFNGAYFDQPIGLTDRQLLDPYDEETRSRYWNEEAGELKYQIGHGCEIDQLCGQWHADLCGLGDLFDREQTRHRPAKPVSEQFQARHARLLQSLPRLLPQRGERHGHLRISGRRDPAGGACAYVRNA